MEQTRNAPAGDPGKVLPFRGRRSDSRGPSARSNARTDTDDLGKYERNDSEPDDWRERQKANAAGLAVCLLLVIAGVWIANRMAEQERSQSCVLAGHRNCAQLSIGNAAR